MKRGRLRCRSEPVQEVDQGVLGKVVERGVWRAGGRGVWTIV